MEATQKALETKLARLQIAVDRTDSILESGYEEMVERHLSALKALASEADQHKRALEEFKMEAKEDIEGIQQWNLEVDAKIITADQAVKRLKTALNDYQEEKTRDKQGKELEFERKLFEAKLQYQTELHLAKEQETNAQLQASSKLSDGELQTGPPAKLPKLHIARFEGTYEDWPRF